MALKSKGLPRAIANNPRLAALTELDIAPITTPDGSDAGTTQTLANATKAKVNEIIAALNGE